MPAAHHADATDAPGSGATWRDGSEPDAAWAPPPPGAPTARAAGRPRPTVVAVALTVGLALLVGLTWRLGGFDVRTDVVSDAAVGSTITTGPYELRFTGATAQRYTDLAGSPVWKVTMVGEGRTTGAESITPDTSRGDGMFVAKDPVSGELHTDAEALHFRPGSFIASSDSFTPGLPMQPFSVEFRFAASYEPGPTITCLVYDLEFRDTSLLGNQDPAWADAATAHRLRLPVQVLAPDTR